MTDGTRQAKQAPQAPEHERARSARRRTDPAPAAEVAAVAPSLSRLASRAALARQVGALAGNAAAVRAIRRAPDGYEADDERESAGPAPARARPDPAPQPDADGVGAESQPLPEPADDERDLPQPSPARAPEPDADGVGAASQPLAEDELAPYRSQMLDIILETTEARQRAVEAQQQYEQIVDDLRRAANPGTVEDVTGDLETKLAEATSQFGTFEAAVRGSKADVAGMVAHGDAAYSPALDRRGGLRTGADATEWLHDVAVARGTYHGVQLAVAGALSKVAEMALGFARVGRELEDADYVAAVLAVGDRAQTALSPPGDPPDMAAVVATPTSHDKHSARFAFVDVVNNMGAVVTGSIGFATSAVGAVTAGLVSTWLGTGIAAVGTILAVRATYQSHQHGKKIEAAKQYLTTDHAKEVATYAKQQKVTKRNRQAALAVLGAATVGVSVAALVLAGGPIGIAIAGLALALAGLGIVAYKAIHSRRKRAAEAKAAEAMANALEIEANEGTPDAVRIVQEVNGGDRAKLVEWCATEVANKRHNSALEIVRLVGSPVPSERFNGETLLEALGVAPGDVTKALDEGDAGKAVGLVERKLASW